MTNPTNTEVLITVKQEKNSEELSDAETSDEETSSYPNNSVNSKRARSDDSENNRNESIVTNRKKSKKNSDFTNLRGNIVPQNNEYVSLLNSNQNHPAMPVAPNTPARSSLVLASLESELQPTVLPQAQLSKNIYSAHIINKINLEIDFARENKQFKSMLKQLGIDINYFKTRDLLHIYSEFGGKREKAILLDDNTWHYCNFVSKKTAFKYISQQIRKYYLNQIKIDESCMESHAKIKLSHILSNCGLWQPFFNDEAWSLLNEIFYLKSKQDNTLYYHVYNLMLVKNHQISIHIHTPPSKDITPEFEPISSIAPNKQFIESDIIDLIYHYLHTDLSQLLKNNPFTKEDWRPAQPIQNDKDNILAKIPVAPLALKCEFKDEAVLKFAQALGLEQHLRTVPFLLHDNQLNSIIDMPRLWRYVGYYLKECFPICLTQHYRGASSSSRMLTQHYSYATRRLIKSFPSYKFNQIFEQLNLNPDLILPFFMKELYCFNSRLFYQVTLRPEVTNVANDNLTFNIKITIPKFLELIKYLLITPLSDVTTLINNWLIETLPTQPTCPLPKILKILAPPIANASIEPVSPCSTTSTSTTPVPMNQSVSRTPATLFYQPSSNSSAQRLEQVEASISSSSNIHNEQQHISTMLAEIEATVKALRGKIADVNSNLSPEQQQKIYEINNQLNILANELEVEEISRKSLT
ncbi:MAG: hypothetical protein ACK4PR_02705 [Gammaproteobacteria bacterium]